MKTLIFRLSFLFSLIILHSCTKVITLDLPKHDPELVVFGNIDQGAQKLRVFVAQSVGILDTTDLGAFYYFEGEDSLTFSQSNWVSNATVNLYEDNNLIATYTANPNLRVYEVNLNTPINGTGKTYRLEVTAPDFTAVSATVEFPEAPQINSLNYQENARVNAYGDSINVTNFTVVDRAASSDYYSFRLRNEYDMAFDMDTTHVKSYSYIQFNDPLIENNMLFDGEINGQAYPLEFTSYSRQYSYYGTELFNQEVFFEALMVNKDYYLFYKTLAAYNETAGNPFAEPVVLYSNIENGKGLFYASNSYIEQVSP